MQAAINYPQSDDADAGSDNTKAQEFIKRIIALVLTLKKTQIQEYGK